MSDQVHLLGNGSASVRRGTVTILYLSPYLPSYLTLPHITLHLTLPLIYLTLTLPCLTLPYILPYLTTTYVLPYLMSYLTLPYTLSYLTLHLTLCFTLPYLIVVVTKKPPMCQIMHFPLYCLNGSIEGKHITLKNSNNTLLAMKSELHTEEHICPLSTHSCNKMITQNSTHRRFFRDDVTSYLTLPYLTLPYHTSYISLRLTLPYILH